MTRRLLLMCGLAAGLLIAGCPTTDTPNTPGNIPDGDPVAPSEASLSISATASVLQLNAAGLSAAEVRFPRQSLLSAVLVNAEAVSFAWSITTPAPLISFIVDGAESATATGETVRVEAVDSPADLQDHTVQVIATLDDGSTETATITIQVQRDPAIQGETTAPTVLITSDPANGTSSTGTVTLEAVVSGFEAGLQFAWSIPDNTPADAALTLPAVTDEQTLELQIPANTSGIFPVQVQVTDQVERTAVALTNVFVGVVDLALDVEVSDFTITGGLADVTLRTVRVGGAGDPADIVYTWSVEVDGVAVVGPSINPPSGTADGDTENDWVFSGLTPGNYRFVGTATDSVGNTVTETTSLSVSEAIGLAVSPSRSRVGTGNGFSLRTFRTGGDGTFTYTLAARDSAGNAAATVFTPASGSTIAAAQTTIMVSGFAAPDTYELAVTVTDSFGASATAVTDVVVGDPLTVDAKSDELFVDPAGSTTVTFDINGGVAPYTFSFASVTSAAGVATFGTASPAVANTDLAVTFNAPNPGAGINGTYRVDVTVTDALGNVAVDSVPIEVGSVGAAFSVEVQAKQVQVGPSNGATALLRTIRTGGAGTFVYTWSVLDSSNANVQGGTITVNAAGSTVPATIDWTVNVGAATPGSYRFQVNVTDNGSGDTAVGSTSILVGDVLTASLTARAGHIAPGAVTQITATPNGGSGTYSFAFDAEDSEGAMAGTLSADPADGATGTVNWVAPTDGSGTYQVHVTVTDTTLSTVATATVPIYVDRYMTNAFINNPPATQDDLGGGGVNGLFEPAQDIDALGGATSVVDFTPSNGTPGLTFARSVNVQFFDNNTVNLVINSIEFIGTNQRGEPIRDLQTGPLATNTTLAFDVPFKTIDRVRLDYANAEAGDDIEIGIGEWFGLADPFATDAEASADQAFHLVATGTTFGTNPETATFLDPGNNAVFETSFATPDQQAVRFPANPPDAARDYNLCYEPLTTIFVDIDADPFILSAGGGEVADLAVDTLGGVPPFDYTLTHLGTLDATSVGTLTLSAASILNESGDLPSSSSGQVTITAGGAPGAAEIHWIHVLVTDNNGSAAAAAVPVIVTP